MSVYGLRLFFIEFRKELLFQWRTKRVLIIAVVFLLFGMLSPLLAEFTPMILGSIEGAEQFAELIPEPTVNDAYVQYIKNITQFGFILAILTGMGAVASERERRTAAMILSKPLPRWIFLLSKFISQSVVYLLGFFLATFAAYGYTAYIFGPIQFWTFATANLLLFIWLTVFVSLSLLGSTLGKTTAAAAGITLVLTVVVLILGSLPRISDYTPGGLIRWAEDMLIANSGDSFYGALVVSAVLIGITLMLAVVTFEKQEL